MKFNKRKNLVLILFVCNHFLWSQNWGYKRFGVSDGLMSNQIDALFIDSKGLLWIANGNGITRYDGRRFVNYLNDSMLTILNKINAFSIKELKDGSIFYSMKYGYVKTSATKKYYLDIYLSDTISLEGENGVTDKNGIRYFKKGIIDFDFKHLQIINRLFKTYPDRHSFPSNLLCSNKGNVFYSFYNKDSDTRTLYLYENNQFKKIADNISFIMSGIFETDKNYYILPEELNVQYPIIIINKKNLSKAFYRISKDIPSLTLIGNGMMYGDYIILSAYEGVLFFNGLTAFFIKDELPGQLKNKDDEKFYQSLFKPMYKYEDYIVNGYRLIDVHSRTIKIPEVIEKEIVRGKEITEVIPDEEGNLWYATNDGLYQVFPLPYEYLYNISLNRIAEVNDSVDAVKRQCVSAVKDIEYCLKNDPENVLILIPDIKDKFYRYDLKTQKITPIYVQGLQSPVLRERLYPIMSYKKILIGQEYTRGLIVYHLNKNTDTAYYHLFNYTKGLLSNYVENVFVDKKENFWIITWDGIQVINYDDLINENYDRSIKYPHSFQLEMIPFMNQEDIYFADGLKLYKIPTSKILYNQKPPKIIIEEINLKSRNKNIKLSFQQDSTYNIPYGFEELKIEFFAACLSDGSKVKYKYILDNTTHFQSEGVIMLSDLKTGKHTIELYASNNFNIWNPQPVRFHIEVLPPFWETWWFRVISLISIAGIIVLIVKKREQNLKQKQIELKELVELRTKELSEKNQLIEKKNTEILDSINYTKRLQTSSLPSERIVQQILKEAFVLYLPKDIISGDFYFSGLIKTNDGKILKGISVGDCTGHGVPGAFMSILLLAYIKQSLTERDVNSPAEALEFISQKIQKVLEYKTEQESEVKDSADMVFAVINPENNVLWCACANNPIYIVRKKQLIEIPAQKRTVGYCNNTEPFINHTFQLEKDDNIYLFSDGYADQFGGVKNNEQKEKKFTKKRFKDLLIEISEMPITEQKKILLEKHLDWRGNSEQTDDICIVGIKIS
jgi:serine phosphatase RsbU (regulator of sigma subunit)